MEKFREQFKKEKDFTYWAEGCNYGSFNDDYVNWLEKKLALTLTDVVNCVYVVTERDNYGEQLFKGVFANREKAIRYLAENGLKESNIHEINEIELD
jgi:hypothetical protein